MFIGWAIKIATIAIFCRIIIIIIHYWQDPSDRVNALKRELHHPDFDFEDAYEEPNRVTVAFVLCFKGEQNHRIEEMLTSMKSIILFSEVAVHFVIVTNQRAIVESQIHQFIYLFI